MEEVNRLAVVLDNYNLPLPIGTLVKISYDTMTLTPLNDENVTLDFDLSNVLVLNN